MIKGSFMQVTVKFPLNKERYRQAVEYITERDRTRFKTQVEYITAAILSYEGKIADNAASLEQIYAKVKEISDRLEGFANEKEEK